MKILLSAGHDKHNKGAYNETCNLHEYDVVRPLANKVALLLNICDYEVKVVESDRLSAVMGELRQEPGDFLAIEFHLNANPGRPGRGTEVLFMDETMREAASQLSYLLSDTMSTRDRGAKQRFDLGFLKATKKALIIESFFLNNDEEVSHCLFDSGLSPLMSVGDIALAHAFSIGCIAAGTRHGLV